MLTGRRSTSTQPREQSISTGKPEAIEFALADGTVVRGTIRQGGSHLIILIHDLGSDLDCWGSLPDDLVADSYSVLAIDLPGHGLSDDQLADPSGIDLIDEIAGFARSIATGKSFAIVIGETVTSAAAADFDALIAISPRPPDDWQRETKRTPCLILLGSGNREATAASDRYFRGRTGWTVSSSFGTTDNGPSLLVSQWAGHVREQIVAFLRDYH